MAVGAYTRLLHREQRHPDLPARRADEDRLRSAQPRSDGGADINVGLTELSSSPAPAKAKSNGLIRGGGSVAMAPLASDAVALPPKPLARRVWSQDFAATSSASPIPAYRLRLACWQGDRATRSRKTGTRNRPLRLADRFPSVTMTGLGADGKRFIQLERHPEASRRAASPSSIPGMASPSSTRPRCCRRRSCPSPSAPQLHRSSPEDGPWSRAHGLPSG